MCIRDSDNETPILLAVKNNDCNSVETLLKHKIDLSAKNKNKQSVFDIAFEKEYFEILKLLLHGADKITLGELRYDKIMQKAAIKDFYDIFEILSKYELDIDITEKNGITPLMKAAGNANLTTVKKLIELGADVSKKDNDGDNALYHAFARDKDAWVMFGDFGSNRKRAEIVNILISKGCDINNINNTGRNVLFGSAKWDRIDLLKLSIEKGLNANIQDDSGKTPLMVAVESENIEIISFLLGCGVDKNLVDVSGKSAMDYANKISGKEKSKEIKKLLQ